jgi:hypothetical protein
MKLRYLTLPAGGSQLDSAVAVTKNKPGGQADN